MASASCRRRSSSSATASACVPGSRYRPMAACSSRESGLGGATKVETARSVGRTLAERAKAAGVSSVVLDRGGYQYHGRVRSLAEGAREGGLNL